MEWLPPSRVITHGNPASVAACEIALIRSMRFIVQLETLDLTEIGDLENLVDEVSLWKKMEQLFGFSLQSYRTCTK